MEAPSSIQDQICPELDVTRSPTFGQAGTQDIAHLASASTSQLATRDDTVVDKIYFDNFVKVPFRFRFLFECHLQRVCQKAIIRVITLSYLVDGSFVYTYTHFKLEEKWWKWDREREREREDGKWRHLCNKLILVLFEADLDSPQTAWFRLGFPASRACSLLLRT